MSFIKQLRIVVSAFWEEEGIREIPLKSILDVKLGEDRIKVLRKIVKLVMQTNFADLYTQLYLSHPTYTYVTATQKGNEITMDNLTDTSVRGRIWYNVNKLSILLGSDSINDIIYHNTPTIDIEQYEAILDKELTSYNTAELDQYIIPLYSASICKHLSKQDFLDLLDLIQPYSKPTVQLVKRSITPEMLGYLNYLISQGDLLDGEDKVNYLEFLDRQ